VGFVDHEDGSAASFCLFGGQGVGGLGHERGVMDQWLPAEGSDDLVVDAADSDGGVREVDDRVAAGVEYGQRGADGDGFPGADLAGNHPDTTFSDAPTDTGNSFAVGGVAVQHPWREIAPERHAGQAVEPLQTVDHRVTSLPVSRSS
jgi:hypothetical protein